MADRYTAEVAVAGNVAYTSTWSFFQAPGNAVKIWNVAGTTPVLVDSLIISGASTTGDVQISADGELLVVATERTNGSIVIFDRSNPTKPTQLARFSSSDTYQGVHTAKLGSAGGRDYAFLAVNPGADATGFTVPAKLVIVDITDPAAPVQVLVREMGNPFVHDVFVRSGLLFTALWDDGVTIWDIGGGNAGGTPQNPVQLGNVRTAGGSAHNIHWYHSASGEKRYMFVGEEGPASLFTRASGDIHVVDVSDLSNPRQVGIYGLPPAGTVTFGTHNFSVDEQNGILYAAYYNGGVRALNIRGDLGSCPDAQKRGGFCDLRLMGREIGHSVEPGVFIWGVQRQGTRLYASDMVSGLLVFDVSELYE